MNKYEISQRLHSARDLLYEAKDIADRNDIPDALYRKQIKDSIPRIINQLRKVELLLKTERRKDGEKCDNK